MAVVLRWFSEGLGQKQKTSEDAISTPLGKGEKARRSWGRQMVLGSRGGTHGWNVPQVKATAWWVSEREKSRQLAGSKFGVSLDGDAVHGGVLEGKIMVSDGYMVRHHVRRLGMRCLEWEEVGLGVIRGRSAQKAKERGRKGIRNEMREQGCGIKDIKSGRIPSHIIGPGGTMTTP